MMTNCPKCGFSQPADQYCANCGVDMLAFRPKERPFHQRILSSSFFQLCMLAAVVGSIFFVVRHQQRMELATRIADIESASPTHLIERKTPTSSRADLASASSEKTPDAQPTLAKPTAEAPRAEAVASVSSSTTASPGALMGDAAPGSQQPSQAPPQPAPASAAPSATSIRIYFSEAPRSFIAELATEADAAAGSYGSLQYGILSDSAARLKAARSVVNWRSLDTTEPQSLKENETTSVYRGPRDDATSEAYGVWVFTKLIKADESGTTLQIEVSRNLTDPGATGEMEQLNKLPLPEIHIPKGGAMFISGLLPHRATPLTPAETRLYRADHVLQVLTSEPFRSNYTDLAIFIEPIAK